MSSTQLTLESATSQPVPFWENEFSAKANDVSEFNHIASAAATLLKVEFSAVVSTDKQGIRTKGCYGEKWWVEALQTGKLPFEISLSYNRPFLLSNSSIENWQAEKDPASKGTKLRFFGVAPLVSPLFPARTLLIVAGTQHCEVSVEQLEQFVALAARLGDRVEAGLLVRKLTQLEQALTVVSQEHNLTLERSRMFERAIVSSSNGIIISDPSQPDNPVIYVNPTFERITGYTTEEIYGKNCRVFQNKDRDQPGLAIMRAAIAEGRECTVVLRNYRKDGTLFWNELHIAPVFNSAGEISNFVGIQTDVTERFRAEEQLKESEKKYRSVINNLKEVVFQTDTQGNFTFLNPAWSESTGFSLEESLHQSFFQYIHPEDQPRLTQIWKKLIKNKKRDERFTIRYLTKDGNYRWMEGRVSLTTETGGVINGLSGTLNDITARKYAETLEGDRNRVLEMVIRNAPLSLILKQIVLMIERQCEGSVCIAHVFREGRLHNIVSGNLSQSFKSSIEEFEQKPVTELADLSLGETGETEPDLTSGPVAEIRWKNLRELALQHGFKSCYSVPVISRTGEVLGILSSYHPEARNLGEHELEVGEMARKLAAIAIEQRRLSDQLLRQAYYDALTGLPNRVFFEDQLKKSFSVYSSKGPDKSGLAVFFVDLDRFKLINDTLGHSVGDSLLQQVAARLVSCLDEQDIVARRGGDEFTVLVQNIKDHQEAIGVAQKLVKVLQKPFMVREYELFVTASVGISLYPVDGDSVADLLRKADVAMYRAKENGRNTYQLFSSEMNEEGLRRWKLENDLHKALEKRELEIYYQPLVQLKDKRVTGVEALLRWKHPVFGLISPAEFIPIAEESGLIFSIGAWVLREACRQVRQWQMSGYAGLRLAVNISVLQFEQSDFIEVVQQALAESGLAAAKLELELGENLFLHDTLDTITKLKRLRELGVRLAMDDFGTGYSSLSYLQRLPIHTLKIDRSFVSHIVEKTTNERAIIRAITTLAHIHGLGVVAEGVETEIQAEFLEGVECEEIQGYLYSPPVPAHAFAQVLKSAA
ncbi:MAG TPA: EAL domain-containing protein [Chloroflexia bacterium]|nr:EAL domain-containing protein [Chloroflexia bacterium]